MLNRVLTKNLPPVNGLPHVLSTPHSTQDLRRCKCKIRRLAGACDYCGDVQVKNMEVEHLWNILLEGAPYMKKYEN